MANRYMVCTDLDRTLIPNGPQSESPAAEGYFSSLVSREEITLVYVSGRHRELVEQAIEQYRIPVPDFVIGDV
ncbi:MAG: HAD family hydrolase, partial [Lysobacterales bacterium]